MTTQPIDRQRMKHLMRKPRDHRRDTVQQVKALARKQQDVQYERMAAEQGRRIAAAAIAFHDHYKLGVRWFK